MQLFLRQIDTISFGSRTSSGGLWDRMEAAFYIFDTPPDYFVVLVIVHWPVNSVLLYSC